MKPAIALIGPGKVGCAVTLRLRQAGYPVSAVVSRKQENATDGCHFIGCTYDAASTDLNRAFLAEIILLAVPDDQLASLATDLSHHPQRLAGKTLIHFSGLHPAACMLTPGSLAATLSIHPLLPFADRELASKRLTGCPCALEGDENSIALGIELTEAFSGKPFRIPTDKKALYHASACVASNYLITLLANAAELLTGCGIEKNEAIPLLMPLVQASIDNVARLGTEQGLTGPIVRGDKGTVATHLAALGNMPQKFLELYTQLGLETVQLAESSTRLTDDCAHLMRELLFSSPLDQQASRTDNKETH